MKKFLHVLFIILMVLGICAFIVGSIGAFVYQLMTYGKYIEFVVYDHWTTYTSYIGFFVTILSSIGMYLVN